MNPIDYLGNLLGNFFGSGSYQLPTSGNVGLQTTNLPTTNQYPTITLNNSNSASGFLSGLFDDGKDSLGYQLGTLGLGLYSLFQNNFCQ